MNSKLLWQKKIPGKWIFSGEHSVLRGGKAIVFPLRSQFLDMSYAQSDKDLTIELIGTKAKELEVFIWSIMDFVLGLLNLNRKSIKGILRIESHIKFGAGMGASATLAVGLSEFLFYLGYVPENDKFNFAKKIEDYFHGESSGVDVAIALHQKPLIYKKNEPLFFVETAKLPKLFLSYSGMRGITKDCVLHVKKIIDEKPDLGHEVDEQMNSVSDKFELNHKSWSISDWSEQIEKAHDCFKKWDLVPELVQNHIDELKTAGAVACKLTGSGRGGYILSLWEQEPPQELKNILIPIES